MLITGATGCAGRHLSALALARGAEVYGTGLTGAFVPGVRGRLVEATNDSAMAECVAQSSPDYVFHLTALLPNSGRTHTLADYWRVNVQGTATLLTAIQNEQPKARVLVASSSAVYGQSLNPGQPITELDALRPQSSYALSKASQDLLAAAFHLEHGLHVVRARTFNQTGPGEPSFLVGATIAGQIAAIECGQQQPPIKVKTLEPARDFSDVRDVVAGYWAALEQGVPGDVYNICSGRSTSIRELAAILVRLSTVPNLEVIEIGPPPREHDVRQQIGDGTRLQACSAWRHEISLEESLRDLLNEWRARLRAVGPGPQP